MEDIKQNILKEVLKMYPNFKKTNICIVKNLYNNKLYSLIYKDNLIGEFTYENSKAIDYREIKKKKRAIDKNQKPSSFSENNQLKLEW